MSIEITPAMLAELEAKAKAAEKGPWEIRGGNVRPSSIWKDGYCIADYITNEDAAYISAVSPDVIQELIKAVRDLLDTVEDRCLTCGMPNEKRMACASECYVGHTLKKYGMYVPENQELK